MTSFNIPASDYIAALKKNAVSHFVTVPDWVQLALHSRIESGADGITQIDCCNEDQAVAVSTGLYTGGKKPIVVIQNQGLYACINTIRAIGLDARLPIVFQIGQFGREFANFGKDPLQSERNMVRLLEPVLDTLGVRYWRVEQADDLRHMQDAFDTAHRDGTPCALLVGAPIGWQ
jgi:sulfopyruvate decarboxylase TPP-binding subunit